MYKRQIYNCYITKWTGFFVIFPIIKNVFSIKFYGIKNLFCSKQWAHGAYLYLVLNKKLTDFSLAWVTHLHIPRLVTEWLREFDKNNCQNKTNKTNKGFLYLYLCIL